MLPKKIDKVHVPPIKIQGIKTKLVPFILATIEWNGKGCYYEPFMGSGVVGFNMNPERAVFSDTNPYLIQFYQDIQNGVVTGDKVRCFLESEGKRLARSAADKSSYYYEVRDRFNHFHNSLDFLFLQRSNFNGMIRFNSKGEYNVPFGRKPERFQKALITKIVNQVNWVESLFKGKKWKFECIPFTEVFKNVKTEDCLYLDPPYIDRYDGYYDQWSQEYADKLISLTENCGATYAVSMWYENKYRKNGHIDAWKKSEVLTKEHFYHIGAYESNRSAMLEALIINRA